MLKVHISVHPATSYIIFVKRIANSEIENYQPDSPANNKCIFFNVFMEGMNFMLQREG